MIAAGTCDAEKLSGLRASLPPKAPPWKESLWDDSFILWGWVRLSHGCQCPGPPSGPQLSRRVTVTVLPRPRRRGGGSESAPA